ncbi:MAG: NAD-dependent malic enzyme [Tepidisphaerales bacterium]
MYDFTEVRNAAGKIEYIETSLRGIQLLEAPLLNKGTAFSQQEKYELGLLGLLPTHELDISLQVKRTYESFQKKPNDLEKHIFLRALQDRNETLFYRLLVTHIEEMMPIIYTPTVGQACQQFGHIYRRPRGLFLAFPNKADMLTMLRNRPVKDVDVIVVTDGQRILGLGDLGAGGMGIPIGKLSLYTACGGIHPARTLPITLDVGTNNPEHLNDPLYIGWRHERVTGKLYEDFVETFIQAVQIELPNVLLQWEDFANTQAFFLLEKYRDRICSFNDDIQGTAAVTAAAILSGLRATGGKWHEQRVVLLGAGSAGAGICQLLLDEMVAAGIPEEQARRAFWSLDSKGLVYHGRAAEITPVKARWARSAAEVAHFAREASGAIGLLEVVRQVKPTILIGVSAQPGTFTEAVIKEMARGTPRPIVLPLSNPTSKIEAHPADILRWTDGKALVATGSPFDDVVVNGVRHVIGQCNNSYIFPGVGLGVTVSRAKRVTDGMFLAAANALADQTPAASEVGAPLLPRLSHIRQVSEAVAAAVAVQAGRDGVAEPMTLEQAKMKVHAAWWEPRYVPIRYRPPRPC